MQPTLNFAPLAPATPSFLKLYDDGPRVGPHCDLRACFSTYVLPDLDERSAATLEGYSDVLNLWERLTANPPVGQITRETVKSFRTRLVESTYKRGHRRLKRSPATVNKHLRVLAAALSPLWPADRHNPGGRGFVPFFKFPEPLPRQRKLVEIFTRSEMSALYRSAEACRCPKMTLIGPLHNPVVWRTAMVLALNTGPRTWDLWKLRWEDVRFGDFRYGSVYYRAQKTAKDQRPPLNLVARLHLLYLRSLNVDPEFVFGMIPYKSDAFYRAWDRICAAASVEAPFERFRKTCSTMHNDLVPGAGEWITGHGLRGVNAEYYDRPTRRVLQATYSLRTPQAFREGAKTLKALLHEAA